MTSVGNLGPGALHGCTFRSYALPMHLASHMNCQVPVYVLLRVHMLSPTGMSPGLPVFRSSERGHVESTGCYRRNCARQRPVQGIGAYSAANSRNRAQTSKAAPQGTGCAIPVCDRALQVVGPRYMCTSTVHINPSLTSETPKATRRPTALLLRSLARLVQPPRQLLPYVIHQLLHGLYDSLRQPRAVQLPVALAVVRAPALPPMSLPPRGAGRSQGTDDVGKRT